VKRALIIAAVLFLFAPLVFGDVVHLKDGGEVSGKITELTLRIGPVPKAFKRGQIASLRCGLKGCELTDAGKTRYLGQIASVSIRTVAGELTFIDKQIKSVEFGALPEKTPVPKSEPVVVPKVDKAPKLTEAERKELKALIVVAGKLRDEYIAKASKMRKAEWKKVGGMLRPKLEAAAADVKEKRKEYAKHATTSDEVKPQVNSGGLGVGFGRTTTVTKAGPGASAMAAMSRAEAKVDAIKRAARDYKRKIDRRAGLRRETVRAYYYRFYRYLTTGRKVPEEVMREHFERALKKVK
jgi:hypothetical protein